MKSDHAHEYIRPYAMLPFRPFPNEPLREEPFHTKAHCLVCGQVKNNPKTRRDALEIEISKKEYYQLVEDL